jgi:hypothetical protein
MRAQRLLASLPFLLFLLTLPFAFPRVAAVPPGADIYVFLGDEQGGRYAVKSNGDGTFGSIALSFTFGDNNRGGAVEDFDEDGDLDAVLCTDEMNECYLFRQGPAGVFTQSTNVEPSGFDLVGIESGMAADDFDQDGHADFLVGGNQNVARIYFGDGTGGFPMKIENLLPTISGFAYRAKDTGDLDGNGYPDVVIGSVTTGNVHAYLNTGGVFSGPFFLFDTTGASNGPFALAVADFDGDGLVDILAGGASDGEVALFRGNGTGSGTGSFVLSGVVHDFNTQAAIGNYDFDGDGDQDLVALARASGEASFFAGRGDGTFEAPVVLGNVTPSAFGVAVPPAPPIRSKVTGKIFQDLNGNGIDDDGSIPIELVSLSLTGTDYLGQPVALATSSGSGGTYVITGIPIDDGGGYTLTVIGPPGGFTPTTTESRSVSIPKESTHVVENFGYQPTATCTDADGDGYSREGGSCGAIDCDDANTSAHPDAPELCNGMDDNCDGTIDEGFDADGDGVTTCGGDCNDGDPSIHPGAEEEWGGGVDTNCDGMVCSMKKDYPPPFTAEEEEEEDDEEEDNDEEDDDEEEEDDEEDNHKFCSGTVIVKNDGELDAYLTDFGLSKEKFKNLRIAYDIHQPQIDIHSPCKILVKQGKTLEGEHVCIDGHRGVRTSPRFTLLAGQAALLSEEGGISIGTEAHLEGEEMRLEGEERVVLQPHAEIIVSALLSLLSPEGRARIGNHASLTVGSLLLRALKEAIIGNHSRISASDVVQVLSTGTEQSSHATLKNHSNLEAASAELTAGKKAEVGNHAKVTTTGNFHMDAPQCSIGSKAVISVGSTSGSCF